MMLFPLSEHCNSVYVTQLRGDFALSVSIPKSISSIVYESIMNIANDSPSLKRNKTLIEV